ncbi:hypothetical protein [Actinomadura sp. 3N407]|uniref:hypothetical protein n=1 Tax=Actinomadura sp. 3N407 TaxID=3457423 RepID=UPI003FCCA569
MPQVGEIALWDTSDADGHDDLVLTVQISDDLRVATSPIEISAFRADVPEGPGAARFALEKILSLRNDLVQALAGYAATGKSDGPAPKDAAIHGGSLICPHCTASDGIVEIDSDTRRNPGAAIDADAVSVHQESSNYATVRFECAACGGEITIPFEVAY